MPTIPRFGSNDPADFVEGQEEPEPIADPEDD